MTNGRVKQLQDLSKCYMPEKYKLRVIMMIFELVLGGKVDGRSKTMFRRLTHRYRHQIAAIKRNQRAAA